MGFALPLGVRALTADGKPLAMTKAAIAGEVHQTLDVHRRGAAKIAFDGVTGVDRFADLQDFGVRKILHAACMIDSQLVGNFDRLGATDAMDVGERNDYALVSR
jgi:hypothetical protein